ncbi:MAG TPA: DUF1080 domain-containing protein [Armatimonadota bacterium]|nr:DUF1080 domain-containing protein [Armatimonadota bacterium]
MTRRLTALCIALVALSSIAISAGATPLNTLTPAEKAAGWRLLFDGKTLNGWKVTGNPEGWAVQDGVIANLAEAGHMLISEEEFGDFILSVEYKLEERTNSGIFFRIADLRDSVQTGIELQLIDSKKPNVINQFSCGSIYNCQAPMKHVCKPAGEWNKVVLTCRDNLIWIDVNGKRTLYMNLDRWTTPKMNPDGTPNKFKTAYKDMARKGYIGFQDHGRKVWFRNIKIKLLPKRCN